jgi:lysophospholipase L1-like esterase
MKHARALVSVLVVLAVGSLLAQQQAQQSPRPRRIAVFGSSVANGTGDELRKEGYTGRLRELLAASGWEVLNQSRGGDNTVTMAPRFAPEGTPNPTTRYLLPVNPGYVAIGLSLGNEGIANVKTIPEKDAVYAQFEKGLRGFIERSRQHQIVPVVTLCYTRNDFTEVEYGYTRRMNLLINTWDVPSVNFLGAVDDGTGKWADGFWNDALHPTAAGHLEMTLTFVPTLFEALERGKSLPARSTATGFARVTAGVAPLSFSPASTMHPFAVSMNVRAQADGTVAAISGSQLTATTVTAPPARAGTPTDRKITTLAAGAPFTATVGVRNGMWTYSASNGTLIRSGVKADASWHQIAVSHYTARGETLFFVDGRLAGKTAERLEPARFVVGGPGSSSGAPAPKQADYKDLLIYRSALNPDEVAALHKGTLLQASLEVYAPLADARFQPDSLLENRAQSMTAVKVGAGTVVHRQ